MISWPAIPSPWLLIGFCLTLAVSNAISFVKGGEARENALLAAAGRAADHVVRKFNATSRADIEAARLAAEREGRARQAARKLAHDYELEVTRGKLLTLQTAPARPAEGNAPEPPLPAGPVQLSAVGIGVFNAAIDAYNAAAQPAGGGGDPVPADVAPRAVDAGGHRGAAHPAGQSLRLSRGLRADAPGGGRVAVAAD